MLCSKYICYLVYQVILYHFANKQRVAVVCYCGVLFLSKIKLTISVTHLLDVVNVPVDGVGHGILAVWSLNGIIWAFWCRGTWFQLEVEVCLSCWDCKARYCASNVYIEVKINSCNVCLIVIGTFNLNSDRMNPVFWRNQNRARINVDVRIRRCYANCGIRSYESRDDRAHQTLAALEVCVDLERDIVIRRRHVNHDVGEGTRRSLKYCVDTRPLIDDEGEREFFDEVCCIFVLNLDAESSKVVGRCKII